MKKSLLDKVKPEVLDVLLDALTDVMNEIKEIEPDKDERRKDEDYVACLGMSLTVFGALRRQVLEKEGKEIAMAIDGCTRQSE